MKVLTILGARPQFIKAGSISRAIAQTSGFKEIIVHTGQHYDANMSDIFFDQMKIPKPDYFLGIGGKSHGAMTGQMIEKIEEVALRENPDCVLVYGDTNSTLAGALVASKLHLKLAHIEAGLRSFNMRMPEEINRILTDRVSQYLFCPTDAAIANLEREGFRSFGCNIVKSGDVMQDGALFYRSLAIRPSLELQENFILATLHRAENTDDSFRLSRIFSALGEIAKDTQIVLPLHPRTRKIVDSLDIQTDNITLIDPIGYLEMVWLIDHCRVVMTDSGGLQKEAYFFAKPCITLRDETEWIELIDHGFNTLVGADYDKILSTWNTIRNAPRKDYSMDLYGGGKASGVIVSELQK